MARRSAPLVVFIFIVALCGGEASSSSPPSTSVSLQVAAISESQAQPQTQPSNVGNATSNADAPYSDADAAAPSLALPTSIGESALVDRESGRIFWQGGPSVLFLSSGSVLGRAGIKHLRATALSAVLLLAALSSLAAWTRDKLVPPSSSSLEMPVIDPTGGHWRTALVFLARCTVLLPRFSTWFVILTAVLYFMEARSCSTRRYLANALRDPGAVESYIEGLRQSPPIATWTVRCFHYERRKTLAWLGFLLDLWLGTPTDGQDQGADFGEGQDGTAVANDDASSATIPRTASFLTKKVVTHRATKRYNFTSWGDNTVVGLWKRAWSPDLTAPFTKMSLSKVLLLADGKARADYFTQQSNFVMLEGQKDQYAEFSTSIQVEGFKPKVLAVRPMRVAPSPKIFRLHLFWFFTCFGLTVPYRIWFSQHCDELRVTIVKETSAAAEKKAKKSRWYSRRSSSSSSLAPPTLGGAERAGSNFRRRMQQVAIYEKDAVESADQAVKTAIGMQEAITESADTVEADTESGIAKEIPGIGETITVLGEVPPLAIESTEATSVNVVSNDPETTEKEEDLEPAPNNNTKESKQNGKQET